MSNDWTFLLLKCARCGATRLAIGHNVDIAGWLGDAVHHGWTLETRDEDVELQVFSDGEVQIRMRGTCQACQPRPARAPFSRRTS